MTSPSFSIHAIAKFAAILLPFAVVALSAPSPAAAAGPQCAASASLFYGSEVSNAGQLAPAQISTRACINVVGLGSYTPYGKILNLDPYWNMYNVHVDIDLYNKSGQFVEEDVNCDWAAINHNYQADCVPAFLEWASGTYYIKMTTSATVGGKKYNSISYSPKVQIL